MSKIQTSPVFRHSLYFEMNEKTYRISTKANWWAFASLSYLTESDWLTGFSCCWNWHVVKALGSWWGAPVERWLGWFGGTGQRFVVKTANWVDLMSQTKKDCQKINQFNHSKCLKSELRSMDFRHSTTVRFPNRSISQQFRFPNSSGFRQIRVSEIRTNKSSDFRHLLLF